MNVTSINQTSGNLSVNQPKQDSHEKNIEKQIMQLQEKMRSIAYDSEMPAEEKDNEKKSLQEKIQTLNSELKQYQIQKRQEEAEKRQEEAKKRETEAKRQQDAAVRQQKAAEQRQSVSANADTPASRSPIRKNILHPCRNFIRAWKDRCVPHRRMMKKPRSRKKWTAYPKVWVKKYKK